ncbi:MAG: hypothetical protein H5T66_09595 [Chloroflexi bacterium]|nr:hypothetical protein [Chloroflexota bacterium]
MAFRSAWLKGWVAGILVVGVCLWPLPVLADASRAGVIIIDGTTGGTPTAICVPFAQKELTGIELLRQARPDLITQVSLAGEAVCKIGSTGCNYPSEDCFCACRGSECLYWSYWYREGDHWVYSARGASSRRVRHGDLDAWVWGNGQTTPPDLTWEEVCSNSPSSLAAQGAQNPSAPSTPYAMQGEPYPGPANTPAPTATPQTNNEGSYPAPAVPTNTAIPVPTETLPSRPTATLRPSNTPREATPTVPQKPTEGPTRAQPPTRQTPEDSWATTAPMTRTPSPEAGISPTAPPVEGAITVETATPDAIAAKIREGVARARATAQARSLTSAPRREYGAFVAIAAILMALAGSIALIQRRRAKAALYPPSDGAPKDGRGETPPSEEPPHSEDGA